MAELNSLQPVNYQTTVVDPFSAAMQGYAGGAAIRDDQQAQAQKVQQQQVQQQQQQVLQALVNNPNPTATDYANASLMVPGMKDQLKQGWDMLNPAQQASQLDLAGQAFSALQSGNPQIAQTLFTNRANAIEASNGGQPTPLSQSLRTKASLIGINPSVALTTLGTTLAALPGGDKVITGSTGLNEDARKQQLQPTVLAKSAADADEAQTKAYVAAHTVPAQIAAPGIANDNTRSQIDQRSQQLAIDRDRLTTETQLKLKELALQYGQLPPAVGEQVTKAATDSIASDQSASQMLGLADQIDKQADALGSGVTATGAELLKKYTGNQNDLTRLRSQYTRIVTPAAMAAYKKVAAGSTSDRDVETALTGVPPDTADPATMSSFLRGMAKIQTFDSVLNDAQSQWLSANRNLGPARQDLTVGGTQIPAGTTFKNFVDQYVGPQVQQRMGAKTVAGRGYMQYATPDAPAQ